MSIHGVAPASMTFMVAARLGTQTVCTTSKATMSWAATSESVLKSGEKTVRKESKLTRVPLCARAMGGPVDGRHVRLSAPTLGARSAGSGSDHSHFTRHCVEAVVALRPYLSNKHGMAVADSYACGNSFPRCRSACSAKRKWSLLVTVRRLYSKDAAFRCEV